MNLKTNISLSWPRRKVSRPWNVTVSSPSYFSVTQEPPNPGEGIIKAHTCRLTSQVASCVRMRTAISLLCCTARCNGEVLFSLSCTFGSKPLFSKSFKASPVLSLIKNRKKMVCKLFSSTLLPLMPNHKGCWNHLKKEQTAQPSH